MTLQELGAKIRAQRAVRGWKQAELAQRLGTSVPSVSRLENGLHDVTFQEVLALAQIFQLSLVALVDSPAFPTASATDTALLLALLRAAGHLERPLLRQLVALTTAIAASHPR